MKFIQQLVRYERILILINRQATVTPKEFAKRLGMSQSTLYEYLNVLKQRGADIKYHKMGTVVGEETGGLKECYGDILTFKLPHSKIECGCSYKFYTGLDLNDVPNDGVKPYVVAECDSCTDEEVVQMIDDIVRQELVQNASK